MVFNFGLGGYGITIAIILFGLFYAMGKASMKEE